MRISDWSSDVCSSDLPCPLKLCALPPESSPSGTHEKGFMSGRVRLMSLSRELLADAVFDAWVRSTSAIVSTSPTRRARLSSTRLAKRSEEHTSELQSLMRISYAVFCLKKKLTTPRQT